MTKQFETPKHDNLSRRKLLKVIAATSGAVVASQMMPTKWAKPVIEAGVLPAHAQGSPWADDGDTDALLPSFRCLQLQENVDVMLTLDISGSVANQTVAAKEALRIFVDSRDLTKDQIGLTSFDYVITVFQELTTNSEAINNSIDSVTSGGATSVAEGVLKSTEELNSSRRNTSNQPVIILISDGDANTMTTLDQAARDQARVAANRAKQQGIRIITIAIGDPTPLPYIRSTLLKEMASTEDDFYHVLNPIVLQQMFASNCSDNSNVTRSINNDNDSDGFEPVEGPNQ